jgi:hypothetical protein
VSILVRAQELQLDVDNALATMEEMDGFLYREWMASKLGTPRELHIHGLRVAARKAIDRLRKNATEEA